MKTTRLAGTDLTVSRLCFGCWGIVSDFHWGQRDPEQSVATIHTALDRGVNFFDTATLYGDGASESLLGQTLAGRREQVVLASKVRFDRMRSREVVTECEDSLRRLRTDYLDLYQTHWTNRETRIEETWGAMLRLKEQGKVRHLGVSNMGSSDLADVGAMEAPVTNQLPYSLLWRMIEFEILPECRRRGIGVLAYSPLMHGMLADKYASPEDVPDNRARSRHFGSQRPHTRHGESGCEAETFAALDEIRAICTRLGRAMSDVALAWCLQQPRVDCIIAGVSSPQQLEANLGCVENPLPDEALHALRRAAEPLKRKLGPNPDMWEGGGATRFR
jgi:aryl-alcohol dehydrogenase-like predicted oxidoreductase